MNRIIGPLLLALLALHLAPSALAQRGSEDYEKGVQAYAQGEYAEAYIHLKNALQVDPNMLPARLLLAKVHFNAGDVHGAAKESEEALLLGADINLVLPVYGTALVLLRRADELFALEKVADQFTPESRFEWALLKGQGYLLRGEADLARREFERAAKLFPTDVRSNNTLAAVYIQNKLYAEAAALIEKSLLLEPDNVKTLELQAELALAEGHTDRALRSLTRAHELDGQDLRVLRSLARAHLLAGNREEMERYLDLILEQSPDDPAATLLSAITAINQGNMEMGQAMLADISLKLAEVDALGVKTSDAMLFIQGAADYVRGSDRSAMEVFNTYLARNGGDLAAIRMLTDLYLRNGEPRRAAQLLGDSREHVLRDRGLSLQLLHLYIQNGSVLSARELLEDLRRSSDDDPFVTILEAELERSIGKPEAALAVLQSREDLALEPSLSYRLLRGALLLDLDRLQEAVLVARELQGAHPNNLRVQNYAAVTYLRVDDLARAEVAIDTALAIAARDIEARFNHAMLLKQRGELDASAKLLNAILGDRPSHTRAIMLMARILFEQGREEEAVEWSKKVFAYDKQSTLPDSFQLDVYSRTGQWRKALDAALQLTRVDPLNEDYLVQLAEIYMQLKDYEVAQSPLRRLAALWQDDAAQLRRLAAMQLRAQNPTEARLSLETALELQPGSYDTRLALTRLDIADGRYEHAVASLDVLDTQFGVRSAQSQLRGEVALARGNPEVAQQHFLRAFELDPGNAEAVARLYALSLEGVGGEAFTDALEKHLRESSLPAPMVQLLADSYLVQGDTESARRYYERLLDHPQFGANPAVLNNLATIYAERDLDRALVTAQRALELDGEKSAALLDTVGWILARQGRHDEALAYLRKAHALNSRDPEIRYHTAVVLLGLDRHAEAASELRAAMAHRASFSGRDEAQRLLDDLDG